MNAVRVAVPRKGRPLEAVLQRFATVADAADVADDVVSTLRFEKSVTKDESGADAGVYERLNRYSDVDDATEPEYTLYRDDRPGKPRRIVFDSLTLTVGDVRVQLVGREEPFRALRTHEFALGFDSADLVLEEVVELRSGPLSSISQLNERIDPLDTDVRVAGGMGDTVYHTLLGTHAVLDGYDGDLTREFVDDYEGQFCISPRYERLVEAVLGTTALEGVTFTYPAGDHEEEEAAIADCGVGAYLTVTGGTAREHGLIVGEQLFPSETVLLANERETDAESREVRDRLLVAEPASVVTS